MAVSLWYAIRPTPLGLRRSGSGVFTRIEAELIEAGVEHYLPTETFCVRHHRTKEWLIKRRALMPYVFVTADGIMDWPRLERECKDHWGPVRVDHVPMRIPLHEIERVRQGEQQINASHAMRHRNATMTKKVLSELYPAGMRVMITDGPLATQQATVLAATGRQAIRAMVHMLGSEIEVTVPVDQIQEAAQ